MLRPGAGGQGGRHVRRGRLARQFHSAWVAGTGAPAGRAQPRPGAARLPHGARLDPDDAAAGGGRDGVRDVAHGVAQGSALPAEVRAAHTPRCATWPIMVARRAPARHNAVVESGAASPAPRRPARRPTATVARDLAPRPTWHSCCL